MTSSGTCLIWDSKDRPPDGPRITVLWREFRDSQSESVHSIPLQVEEQAGALRARFLAWLFELGESVIDGRRLVDHLELRPGLSFWWMTLLSEKSYAKSSRLNDAVKFLALESIEGIRSCGKVILASGDATLARTFRLWCRRSQTDFEWRRLETRQPSSVASRVRSLAPHPSRAAAALARHVWERWILRQKEVSRPAHANREITFVDVLFNLAPESLAQGRFASNYWTDLIAALDESAVRVNWIHHYFRHGDVPSAKAARALIARFNQRASQAHTMLDGALEWATVWGTVRDYLRVARVGYRLGKAARRLFRPPGTQLDLWPLFEEDWRSSLAGTAAVSNCLFLNLFERSLRRLPHQDLGLFLQENQAWERGFVHAWKAAGHGRLVGVRHSAISFWDLRFYVDPRSYRRSGTNDLPMPDLVALNGPAVVAAYKDGGYPPDQIVEVEALRYLYLSDLQDSERHAKKRVRGPLHVLVLGDYRRPLTSQLMQWLSAAASELPADTRYLTRAHPACPIDLAAYPTLKLQPANSSLSELLGDCDVAYTSNVSSAAVDAYSAGVPVVSILDGDEFNMSPLRGQAGVTYVTNPSALARALREAPGTRQALPQPYFCVDRQLPRWRRLLGLEPRSG